MRLARKTRLIVVCAVVLAVLLGTGAVLFERYSFQERVRRASDRLMLLNSLRREALETLFETARAEITFWSMAEDLLDKQRTLVERWKIYASRVGHPGEALKQIYIESNPYPAGRRREWDDAGDGSIYSALHADLHPLAKLFVVERGYYDFFLISPDGDVFYTVEKEDDFGSNVKDASLRDTGLAAVFRRALADPNRVCFSDLERYAPSAGEPAMFMARAMREEGGAIIGVLAFQLPIHRIKAIMNFDAGMGATGETYLVGSDFLMRSDSRFSQTSTGVDTWTRRNPPPGSIMARTSLRTGSNGAMGAQMAIPPFLVISEATKPIRAMLRFRCSREKPSSDDRFLRTMSPSRIVTGRPPRSRSFTRRTLARVDLPELGSPEKKTVKPWRERGGDARRSSRTTSGNENHSGISRPKASRSASSAGVRVLTSAPFGTASSATKPAPSGR